METTTSGGASRGVADVPLQFCPTVNQKKKVKVKKKSKMVILCLWGSASRGVADGLQVLLHFRPTVTKKKKLTKELKKT